MKKYLLSLALAACAFVGAKADEVTFDFVNETYGLTRETSNDGAYIDNGVTCENAPITMTLFKAAGKNGMRLWSDGLRFYKSSTAGFELSIENGTITGVDITVVSGATFAMDGESSNATSWTCDASSVKINYTASQNKALKTVKVTYEAGEVDPDALPKPQITLEGRTVTITCADADAQIRYTNFDGADIDTDYEVYYQPFPLYMSATVQAVAYKDGKTSAVASLKCVVPMQIESLYGLSDLYPETNGGTGVLVEYTEPLAVAAQANPYLWLTDMQGAYVVIYGYRDEVYHAGEIVTGFTGTTANYQGLWQIANATVGAVDETFGTMEIEPMEGLAEDVAANMQGKYLAFNGVEIAANGTRKYTVTTEDGSFTMYDSAKAFTDFVPEAGRSYDIAGFVGVNNGTAQLIPVKIVEAALPVCEAPVFTPAAGEYKKVTSVTIECATEGAKIYYTLDGSVPTIESTEYTEAIVLDATGEYTVKAIAVAAGHTESEVAEAVYTLDLTTGIDSIAVGEGEAEYFNLQGIRVEQPAPGLYIRRVAGKAVKVLVK